VGKVTLELAPIIQRCQSGDELAWERLIRSQQGRVYALCCHYTRDRTEAHDLAQEVFVRVYRRLGDLEDPERFVPWLLRIARNAAIDHTRRRKARPPAQDVPAEDMRTLQDSASSPAAAAEARSDQRLVHRALQMIGSKHREVLLLHEIQGLALEEIADMLSLPVGTVKSRSSRARRELAQAVLSIEGGAA
jgi:RNA polymerase sigma-70 factor (ECF subfamily)